MTQTEERMKIFTMLQEGKITAEEASALIDAIEKPQDRNLGIETQSQSAEVQGKGRWLRVKVSDINTNKNKVNIRIPIGLVASGLRFGLKFAPEIEGLNAEELMAWIRRGEIGQMVDVTDHEDGEHVEVYIE